MSDNMLAEIIDKIEELKYAKRRNAPVHFAKGVKILDDMIDKHNASIDIEDKDKSSKR